MESRNIEFVGEVEKYPELYDYRNPFYSRRDVVERAWNEIGRKFGMTGNESKDKWKNLRNSFVKYLKPPASGSSAKRRKAYYLSEAMNFALPFVKVSGVRSGSLPEPKVPTPAPVSPGNCPVVELPEEGTQNAEEESQSWSPPTTPPLPPPLFSALHRSSSPSSGPSEERRIPLKRHQAQQVNRHSEGIRMFLLSLLPDLEVLSPAEVRSFKMKTLALVDELSARSSGANPSLSSQPPPSTVCKCHGEGSLEESVMS